MSTDGYTIAPPALTPLESYQLTPATVEWRIDPRDLSADHPEYVALALAADLRQIALETGIDFAAYLNVPADEYLWHAHDLIEEICDDIERMLRYRLLTAIHVLLSDPEPHPATGIYTARYHALYTIEVPRTLGSEPPAQTSVERPAITRDLWQDARFALVVDWDAKADWQKRSQLRRPAYNFDWATALDPYYPSTVVRYDEGGIARASASPLG